MTCLCHEIPLQKSVLVLDGAKTIHSYHVDCPEHGIVVTLGPLLERHLVRQWMSPQEALGVRTYEGVRVVEKTPDRQRALIEWVVWRMPATEKEEEKTDG